MSRLSCLRRISREAVYALVLFTNIAVAGPLSVRIEQTDFYRETTLSSSLIIVLEGEIDAEAPARVAAALKNAGRKGADVYIQSPGGSLVAGMEIGRTIRKAGANTYIGGIQPWKPNAVRGKPFAHKPTPGVCYSACALAFLGGVYRYINSGSEYGVHRFSSTAAPNSTDLDMAQIVSAAVAGYIREMEVDPGLFDLMVQAGHDEIYRLTPVELKELRVINDGRKKPEWTIEAVEGGQYLRGVQESVHGQGKAVFYCLKGQVFFHSFYNAGAELGSSIAKGGWQHSLLADNKTLPLPDPIKIENRGAEISAVWKIPKEYSVAISTSKNLGHAMQLSREAPSFVGYQIDIPSGQASQRVRSFLRNCLN